MNLIYNPVTWFIRMRLWRQGWDISRYPNVPAMLEKVDLVIDAGANRGNSYEYFRLMGYQGRVISYEPTPEIFEVLKAKPGHNWERHPTCLSDKIEKVQFYIRRGGGKDLEWNGLERSTEIKDSESITVETRRLDELLKNDPAKNIFLKIDTEGHDLKVFQGARGLHPRVRYVIMEVSATPRFQDEPSFGRIMTEMEAMGFEVATILGNIYGPDRIQNAAMDVIFVPRKGFFSTAAA